MAIDGLAGLARKLEETLKVPSLWSIDRCTKHDDYVTDCLRCQEEVLTVKLECAYRAGFTAALAAFLAATEGK